MRQAESPLGGSVSKLQQYYSSTLLCEDSHSQQAEENEKKDMEFGAAGPSEQHGCLNFFDGGATAAEISSALQKMPRLDAAAAQFGAAKAKKNGKGRVVEAPGNQQAAAAAVVAPAAAKTAVAAGHVLQQRPEHQAGSDRNTSSMLAMAQKSTRTAKNGREQQRAQKISDVIDQLKATLDKANVSDESSSKLHVLVSCESYLRSLRDKIQCYEMEIKLREAARGHRQQVPADSHTARASGSSVDNYVKSWAAKGNAAVIGPAREGRSTKPAIGGSSPSEETDRMDTAEDFCSGSGSGSGGDTRFSNSSSVSRGSSSSSSSGGGSGSGRRSKKQRLYSASSSSSDDNENSLGDGGVGGVGGSSSTGSDGDAGSSDSGGGSTSAGTTDSGSQDFTTDTTSRGFTTDSSFSGYTGSLGSGGDAGSADGGSDESEEGTAGARMRVVNYFDIFRLSNVPMAIADKAGALVDVNDAMRGFGRINQETVSTLTVRSLVAPESAQALQDAMSGMLLAAAASSPSQSPVTSPQIGAQPFLANAGIGNRPTLLTVSLVFDEGGEASAFHVALIPRTTGAGNGGGSSGSCTDGGGDTDGLAACRERHSTEYDADAPEFSVQAEKGEGGGGCSAGKRGRPRSWDAGGQSKSQKRRSGQAL